MNKLQRPDHPWMIVHVTHVLEEAYIVAGRLHHEGIAALVDYAPGSRAFGITIGQLGEVRVLVHPENYERALLILDPELPPELPDAAQSDLLFPEEGDDDDQ